MQHTLTVSGRVPPPGDSRTPLDTWQQQHATPAGSTADVLARLHREGVIHFTAGCPLCATTEGESNA